MAGISCLEQDVEDEHHHPEEGRSQRNRRTPLLVRDQSEVLRRNICILIMKLYISEDGNN